jgi:hypothetical protein
MKVVRLSALHTHCIYLPGNIPCTYFCWRLSRHQGHSAAGRIMSMKYPTDPIGKRTCYLPARSAVPRLTAPPNTANIKTDVLEIKLWDGGQCLNWIWLVQDRNQVQGFSKLILKSVGFEVFTAHS